MLALAPSLVVFNEGSDPMPNAVHLGLLLPQAVGLVGGRATRTG